MNQSTWDLLKPIAAQAARDFLRTVGMALAAHGYITNGSAGTEAFIGAGMTLAGLFWGWFTTVGYVKVAGLIKKLTAAKTPADAVAAAQVLPPGAAVDTASKSASAASVAKVIIAALLLGGLLIGDARAETPLPKPRVNLDPMGLFPSPAAKATATLDNIATTLAKPFQDIAAFIGDDADQAISLSTVIPALQDGHGQQCWMAMKSFGDIIKAHPVPLTFHIINDYETLRLLGMATNNLCSNVHCTQVFADATAMAQAASPMPLAIPSLHDLCTKVPQIAVVAPVTVTPAAAPVAK